MNHLPITVVEAGWRIQQPTQVTQCKGRSRIRIWLLGLCFVCLYHAVPLCLGTPCICAAREVMLNGIVAESYMELTCLLSFGQSSTEKHSCSRHSFKWQRNRRNQETKLSPLLWAMANKQDGKKISCMVL